MARKKSQKKDTSRIKIKAVIGLFVLVWVLLWARAGYLQLVEGPKLAKLASRQHLAAEFEKGERGRILDRKGRVLAKSVESRSVYVRPLEVKDTAKVVRVLAGILKTPASSLRKKLCSKRNFVWLKRQIGDRAAARISQAHLSGIYLATEYSRLYPNGRLAGQLLGFVGVDGKGLEGLERSFEEDLAPGKARFVVQKDASGRKLYLDAQGHEMNIDGHDVRLTIDSNVQQLTEDALAESVVKYNGRSGMAVVVDAKNGDILAMANYPFFNPNVFRSMSPKDWRNRAGLDVFEPGSTFKPFLFGAALDTGQIKRDTLIDCENGRWRVSRHTIRDTHPEKWLPAHKVLRYSSNIGSAKIGLGLGARTMYDYFRKLGFGERTHLPIPGQSVGILRPPSQWRELDIAAASFGQGVGVTALQMAEGYLCLASGGIKKPLRLVKGGDVPEPKRVFSSKTAAEVMTMLTEVVEKDGTGRKARIAGLKTAGKTGTAQKAVKEGGYGDMYLSSFISIVPADDPEFIIVVQVDEPTKSDYGGVVAAPAARLIALRSLAYFGYLPEVGQNMALAEESPVRATAREMAVKPIPTAGKVVPDVTGLPVRRAVEVLVTKGVVPTIKGDGAVVAKQTPRPGKPWPKGTGNNAFVLWLEQG